MTNCIFRANDPIEIFQPRSAIVIQWSNIQGGWPGEGNIDADPLFMDPENGDFRLQENSPCIDSASSSGPSTDIEGNPRPVDIPGVGRDSTGDEFDMGPYERPATGNPTHTPTITPTFTLTPTFTPTPTSTPMPKVIYVDSEAPEGGDGTSWANACRSVEVAVEGANFGDSVWVREGDYLEDQILLMESIQVLGGFRREGKGDLSSRDPILSPSLIRAKQTREPTLYIRSEEGPFKVDGFVIEGGGDREQIGGGGIYIAVTEGELANVTIRDCTTMFSG
ncbi:MAG: hypothetical protein KC964_09620, partial [Candidatus Omnitrophica bacterium]|nr:hypothetical protein [Candidatus Omnitrophota bacterium]